MSKYINCLILYSDGAKYFKGKTKFHKIYNRKLTEKVI